TISTTTTETTTSKTTPTTTSTTKETSTPSTTTPTTTSTTTTETSTPSTTTPTPTPSTTTPTITTTTVTPTPTTTTPPITTTTTETPTPSTTTPSTTTTTETPTQSTTTPTITTTTTTETTTPSTATSTTAETTSSWTTTPTTTTTTTTSGQGKGKGKREKSSDLDKLPFYLKIEINRHFKAWNTSCPDVHGETTTSTPTTTTTTTSTPTTTPETTTPITTTPGTTTPTTTCIPEVTSTPPSDCKTPNGTLIRQIRESYWPCNCTEAICKDNDTWVLNTIICEDVPKPNCSNGLTPVRVKDECCWHWECDCYCTGWGDPHYVTFDGQYYSYQGNCTYVLVEEIHKKIDNFGVYIDNYHCDARETVSCPRTLIVKYETQEVHVKTLKMFPFIIQVKVNGQEVATPYEKYGMKVFKSGVNYVVEIERIGVNVSYNRLSFSVRLAYKLFGNNTQGQCGTCNNNKTDDCMLPNGKFPGSCETMADHWVVHDPEKPQCTPSVIPTPGPPPVPDTCKPSALCELFKGSVFEKCHRLVDYHNYYRACIYDSCFIPNSQLECASLQIYATICADQGVCVDWRGYTHGTCALNCPSHRVYKACGPIEEVTCK
uniref:VWFD domain-containing protein n=1 Tax=Pelodiscus sinensis TaxID=13735 RepID=K7FKT1_PELSI